MEAEFNHLNHATWECKYHVVFTPKYRKKLLFGKIKRLWAKCFTICVTEGVPDRGRTFDAGSRSHVISIPPKYSVAQIIGYMKGKSSIWISQNVERKMRNFPGHKIRGAGTL